MSVTVWLTRSVVDAKVTRRLVTMWWLRVSLFPVFFVPSSDMSVVDKVPTTHHQVHPVVPLTKPATQPKKVAAKGKDVAHPVTQLWAHKVTWVPSVSPEVTVHGPPVVDPSRVMCTLLFEETALL